MGLLGGVELPWPSFPSPAGRYEVHLDMCYAGMCTQTYVHVSEQMWVDSKTWQDCRESNHCGSKEKPLLPSSSPWRGPGGGGHGGY